MGFFRIFWKNNVQEAYLPKMSISGQIVSEIEAQLYSRKMHTNRSYFWGVDAKISCNNVLEHATGSSSKAAETMHAN